MATQCDVKTRWPDGSVQHALVSFFAPLKRGEPLRADFVNQDSSNNTGPLTLREMLNSSRWDARIEATAGGETKVADARTMLAGGAWRYWLQGPICTQVIVEGDRSRESTAFAYDFGWQWNGKEMRAAADARFRSLHPIFVLTFYHGWKGIKVEAILENDWATRLQDQQYTLAIRKQEDGHPMVVFQRPELLHSAESRWRKVFWCGDEPGPVNVDYNLPYMIYSRVLPSYDLSKVVSAVAIESEAAAFRGTDRGEIFGTGQWQPYFPQTGGRPDIGLFPRWYVRYLYTFDPELYNVMTADGAVSAYVPIHLRESIPNRLFLTGQPDAALGRVISIDARPTLRTTEQKENTLTQDGLGAVGAIARSKWTVDLAHQSSFVFIPYLITGDWYFLEELYFWAAYDLAHGNPGTVAYGRHRDWGFVNDGEQIRSVAWALRNLAHASLAAPEGTPEKAYFTQKLDDNIAVREGEYGIRNGAFYQPCMTEPYDAGRETSKWCWGRNTVSGSVENPLHFLDPGSPGARQTLDPDKTYAGSSPWMWNYVLIVLGHLRDIGFRAQGLEEALATNLLHQIADPDYNPYLTGSYRIPVRKSETVFFKSWAQVRQAYPNGDMNSFHSGDAANAEHGYVHIAQAAASFLPGLRDGSLSGSKAWEWMRANVPDQDLLNDNPKWALVPRPSGDELAELAARRERRASEVREQRRHRLN